MCPLCSPVPDVFPPLALFKRKKHFSNPLVHPLTRRRTAWTKQMFCLVSQFAADIFTFLDNGVRNEAYSHELRHNWYGEGISMRQWWRNYHGHDGLLVGGITYQEDRWPLSIGQEEEGVVPRCHGSVPALHKTHSLCTLSLCNCPVTYEVAAPLPQLWQQ